MLGNYVFFLQYVSIDYGTDRVTDVVDGLNWFALSHRGLSRATLLILLIVLMFFVNEVGEFMSYFTNFRGSVGPAGLEDVEVVVLEEMAQAVLHEDEPPHQHSHIQLFLYLLCVVVHVGHFGPVRGPVEHLLAVRVDAELQELEEVSLLDDWDLLFWNEVLIWVLLAGFCVGLEYL